MALRFATPMLLQVESKRRVEISVVLFVALLEYLVLNGFNALNVQLRAEPVQPEMTMSDLSLAVTLHSSVTNATNVTTASMTFSEISPQNPITNTALRNLVVPRVALPTPTTRKCSNNFIGLKRLDVVDFEFPSRSWHLDMLSVALDPKTARVPLNNDTSMSDVAQKLPMAVSTATNLFVSVITYTDEVFHWENNLEMFRRIKKRFEEEGGNSTVVSIADRMGVRPPDSVNSNARMSGSFGKLAHF